jgi:hypothetical protein
LQRNIWSMCEDMIIHVNPKDLFFSTLHRACCHIHFIKNQLMHLLKKHSFTFTLYTLKLVKKCSVKGVIIKLHMFRSLFHDHPQGSPFVLSAPTTYQPPASSFVFSGLWPYVLYLYVCPVYLSVCCLVVLCTTRQHTDN